MDVASHAIYTFPYTTLFRSLHFVASPRHADCLLVTGPVTRNMADPLKRTYDATPAPKIVIAIGDCAKDCGVFRGRSEEHTSELQSHVNLVCRLLLEKKKYPLMCAHPNQTGVLKASWHDSRYSNEC